MIRNDALTLTSEYSSSIQTVCKLKSGNDGIQAWPKISIVMPSFNQVAYVERSLLSVINQGYPNLELIVVDGGSTDGTMDVICKYANHITYLVSEPDRGQSDALNKGYKLATGDIYGWLNSDDIYTPNAFYLAVEAFRYYPDKKIIFGDWDSINENDCILTHEYAFPMSIGQTKYEGVSINAQAMFWRRSVHERFGKFDYTLYNTMDYQMVLAFGVREGESAFLRVSHTLGCFRRYNGQKTGPANHERQLLEHRYLAQRYGYTDKYTATGKLKRLFFRVRRAYWYVRRAGLLYALNKMAGTHINISSRSIER